MREISIKHKRLIFFISLISILIFFLIKLIKYKNEQERLLDNQNNDDEFYQYSSLNEKMRIIEKNFDLKNVTSRKYVFFDLGANNGDSAANFFGLKRQLNQQKFPFVIQREQIDSVEWDVYLFEANPLFNEKLHNLKAKIEKRKHNNRVFLYNSTAAWIYDGYIKFYLDTVNRENDFFGSSLELSHPDVIKSGKQYQKVKCVDIAKLLRKYNRNDFLILKIDIEGSEFQFMVHLIKENVLDLIDLMHVEYHLDAQSKFRTSEQILNYIYRYFGIVVSKWV